MTTTEGAEAAAGVDVEEIVEAMVTIAETMAMIVEVMEVIEAMVGVVIEAEVVVDVADSMIIHPEVVVEDVEVIMKGVMTTTITMAIMNLKDPLHNMRYAFTMVFQNCFV